MASFLLWRGLNVGDPGHPCSKVSANDCCEYLGQVLLNSFGTAIAVIIVINTIFLFYSKVKNTATSCKYKIQQVKSKSYLEVVSPALPCSEGKGLHFDLSGCLRSAASLLLSPLSRARPQEDPGRPAKGTGCRQGPRLDRRKRKEEEEEEEGGGEQDAMVMVEEEEYGEDRRSRTRSRSQSRSCSPQRRPLQEAVSLGDDDEEAMEEEEEEDEEEEEEEEESPSSASAPGPRSHRDGHLAARGPCPPPPPPAPRGRARASPSPSFSSSCAAAAGCAPAVGGAAGRPAPLPPSSSPPPSSSAASSPSSPSPAGARSTSFAASSSRAGPGVAEGVAEGGAGRSLSSSSCASVSPAPAHPPRFAYPRGPVCPRPCCCGREPAPAPPPHHHQQQQHHPRGGHDTSPWRLPVYRECPAAALRHMDTSPARPPPTPQPWRGGGSQGLARGAEPTPTPIRICSTRHLRPEGVRPPGHLPRPASAAHRPQQPSPLPRARAVPPGLPAGTPTFHRPERSGE